MPQQPEPRSDPNVTTWNRKTSLRGPIAFSCIAFQADSEGPCAAASRSLATESGRESLRYPRFGGMILVEFFPVAVGNRAS